MEKGGQITHGTTQRYTIRRLHYFAALKFGCMTGAIFMMLPALATGWVVGRVVAGIRGWLEANSILDLPGILPDLNLLQLLGLGEELALVQAWDDLGVALTLAVALVLFILGALWFGVAAFLGAALYNVVAAFSGGLTFSAETGGGRVGMQPAGKRAPVPTEAPAAWLADRQNPQRRWPVGSGRTTIGSAADNDLIISGLSPQHAVMQRREEGYALYDLSGGRTRVNGRSIAAGVWLNAGDAVRLEPYDFTFQVG